MLITGQVSATETAGALCTVPSGACLITITSDPGSADTAYIIGLSPAGDSQSAADEGLPLAPGQSISTVTYGDTTGETALQVACGSGNTATVGYLISSH
jgi:hypothetical protein